MITKTKRGQMEILGLLIIVILFSLGLLFSLKYIILKPQVDTKQTYIQSELSSNTLSAFLKTTSSCREADMTELFRDCASFPSLDCDLDGDSIDNTLSSQLEDSCSILKQALTQIFSETLDKWKIDYNFSAYTDTPLEWTKELGYGNCGPFDEGKPQQFTIPTDVGDLTVELKIC